MDEREKLKANPALYRAELSCRIGKDTIEGKKDPPPGVSRADWVMWLLLNAIEDLAKAGYSK